MSLKNTILKFPGEGSFIVPKIKNPQYSNLVNDEGRSYGTDTNTTQTPIEIFDYLADDNSYKKTKYLLFKDYTRVVGSGISKEQQEQLNIENYLRNNPYQVNNTPATKYDFTKINKFVTPVQGNNMQNAQTNSGPAGSDTYYSSGNAGNNGNTANNGVNYGGKTTALGFNINNGQLLNKPNTIFSPAMIGAVVVIAVGVYIILK